MAVSNQQQALVRKVVYTGLIVALFTVSLIHKSAVKRQAEDLRLLEVSQGKVEFTDSAVRLALTGSRGIAVTLLWSAAIEKQKKHEWNELEPLVKTITRLQPHFITPWLFQSWNLAFNVAVECDRPRDKYYYVSRGLELLAEGESRNYRPPSPGNPDMRQNMGFYYQLKIGSSDEKNTMRCLLEMSCIDPLDRAPDRFLESNPGRGKKVKLDQFKEFCIKYPRLVRRLHDQLGLTTPEDIVRFLDDNQDVPSRFEPPRPQQKDSEVKKEGKQFPILPPGRSDPESRELSSTEVVDVFWVCRNWYEYAQKPLPEPDPDTTVEPNPNPLVKRLPRYIAVQIFRGYPARAQAYIAENLEAEGWFDADGWAIKKWFDKERGPNDPELRVGTDPKYHAGPSWETAYQMYLDYGTRSGLYMEPAEWAQLNEVANPYRLKFNKKVGEWGPPQREGEMGKSYHAHARINYTVLYGNMTNFGDFLAQTDAERTPDAVTARKYFYNADRIRRAEDPERAIPLYHKAWQLWIQTLLANPKFARLPNIQEDAYDIQIPYNFYVQKHRSEIFKPLLLGMAQLANWPYPPYDERLTSSQKIKIMPVRNVRGLLDYVAYYDGPGAPDLKMALAGWTQGAIQGMHLVTPLQVHAQLTRTIARDTPLPLHWRTFVDEDTANRVRDRLGLNRGEKTEQTEKK